VGPVKEGPPFLIMHGTKDPTVPFSQSELLVEALKKAGVEVTLVPLEGAGHGGKEFQTADIRRQIEEFFDRHLKRPAKKG
jgi:dipeptidyl aminopeptidase/acylaminoacyl peptidase